MKLLNTILLYLWAFIIFDCFNDIVNEKANIWTGVFLIISFSFAIDCIKELMSPEEEEE